MRRVVSVILALSALLWAPRLEACATAPPENFVVNIVAEDALIVWDDERKIEHFVRRADFRSDSMAKLRASGFGFLVPTPTRPELGEVPDQIFSQLEEAIRPERISETRYEVIWASCGLLSAGRPGDAASGATAVAPVQVLERSRVAGFDAAVLKATDADALSRWLTDHGYAFRPALRDWLNRYVDSQWIITAFKIATESAAGDGIGTAAVRMSFATERPFYPYREPEDARQHPRRRSLRLFVAGPARLQGRIADGTPWPGKLWHAAPLTDAATTLAGALPAGAMPSGKTWLHTFVDSSAPRPGSDELFFARDEDQRTRRLPRTVDVETITIPLLLDVVAFFGLLLFGFVWARRKRAQR